MKWLKKQVCFVRSSNITVKSYVCSSFQYISVTKRPPALRDISVLSDECYECIQTC